MEDQSNNKLSPNRGCWNCGSIKSTLLFEACDFDTAKETFEIVTCRSCGLSYTKDVSEATLASSYSKNYYGSDKAKFVSVIEAMVRLGQRRQAKKILRVYNKDRSGAAAGSLSVLDIGCGRGLLLKAFAELGAQCLGIEREQFPGIESAEVDIHVGAMGDAQLENRRFDIIVIWHVLEHITELGQLLEELPRHLNQGGLLVVSVPNFSSWQAGWFKQHWFHLDLPRHVTHFSQGWLETKLRDLHIPTIERSTFTPTQNVYGFLQSSLNAVFSKQPNRLYHLLTRGRGAIERLSLLGWGTLGALLMPFSILETIFSELAGRGATLTLYARKDEAAE